MWEVEGIGGYSLRLQVDCYCILANADLVLVVLMPLHILHKHPANSRSSARQRRLRHRKRQQPTTTTNQLLQKPQILYSSYSLQLKTIIFLIRDFFEFPSEGNLSGAPPVASTCNFMLRWLISAAKAKPHSSTMTMKDMLGCSPPNSLGSVICFVDSSY